jgi:hypothetical protein
MIKADLQTRVGKLRVSAHFLTSDIYVFSPTRAFSLKIGNWRGRLALLGFQQREERWLAVKWGSQGFQPLPVEEIRNYLFPQKGLNVDHCKALIEAVAEAMPGWMKSHSRQLRTAAIPFFQSRLQAEVCAIAHFARTFPRNVASLQKEAVALWGDACAQKIAPLSAALDSLSQMLDRDRVFHELVAPLAKANA